MKYTDSDGRSGKLTIYASGNGVIDGHAWESATGCNNSNSISRSVGSTSAGSGNVANVSLQPIYESSNQ